MKKLLTIFCLVLLTSYSYSQDVSKNLLVKKDGTVYEIKSDKLFTGTLVEYHDSGQLRVRATFKDGKENVSMRVTTKTANYISGRPIKTQYQTVSGKGSTKTVN